MDLKKCLSASLTNLQPWICGKICLVARKGYRCSKILLSATQLFSKGPEWKEQNDVVAHVPSQGLSWKHEAPQVKCPCTREGPYFRWVEGEVHEALSVSNGHTQPSPGENGSYNVLCQCNHPITLAAPVGTGEWCWFWWAPWRMSWPPVTSGTLEKAWTIPTQEICSMPTGSILTS